jgi:predicted RNA binding protein YcfA (HicA-like mRNA interferase family)
MKLPRDVYGRDFANHLIREWDFRETRQTGSHIILESDDPAFHVSIPAHKPMRTGTFSDIAHYVAELRGVSVQELLKKL